MEKSEPTRTDIPARIHLALYHESDSPRGKPEMWRMGHVAGSVIRLDRGLPDRYPYLSDAEWENWKRGWHAAHMRRVMTSDKGGDK